MSEKVHPKSNPDKTADRRAELEAALTRGEAPQEIRRALQALLEDLEENQRAANRGRRDWMSAMDAVQDLVFLHDRDFKIIRANRAYAVRVGMNVREVIGKPYWQLFPKSDGPSPGCVHAMRRERTDEEELRLPSGEEFIVHYYPILDDEGNFVRALHTMRDVTEKRRVEAEQRMLSQALAQTSESILILNKALRISYVNPAFRRQLGYSDRDVIGRHVSELGPPPIPDLPTDAVQVETWMRKLGSWAGETAMPAKDGTTIPVYLTLAPINDSKGSVVGYVATHLDLREIKQAELKLRESEEQLRAMSTAAQDAMLMLDDAGRVVFWNEAASRLFGHAAEEALGRDAHALIAPERYQDDYHSAWPQFTEEGRGPIIGKVRELDARRKDGTEFPIELSVSALRLKGRWHAVGIVRDITERKRAERSLHDSELRFRGLVESSSDWVWEVDAEGVYTYASPRVLDILGYAPEEVLGTTPFDLMPPEEADRVKAEFLRLVAEKRPIHMLENVNRHKDGRLMVLETSGMPILNTRGELCGYRGMDRDITERKQSERSIRRVNRALKTLSSCNTALIHAMQEEQLLADMCRTVVEEGGYRLAWIGFVEHDEDRSVRPVASAGFEEGYLESLRITWADTERGQGPTGRAVRLGTPQVAEDIRTDPRFSLWREQALQRGYASSIALPLKEKKGEVFGVLSIYAPEPHAFDETELRLLQELADDLAFGVLTLRTRLERDHFQQEHLKSLDRLKEVLVGTIRAIALTVEKRDPYTAGHQNRVAGLASAIAEELGLDADRIEGIKLGGTIHDIGKIYVPAEILNRPGRLTAPEFEMIKSHPQVGYDIIKDVKFPWPVADMMLQHHERLDGSGYPQALKGEAICLEARILAVADVVEAITAHRPYRPALGIDLALAEIETRRDQLYDAQSVDACVRLFREKKYKLGE